MTDATELDEITRIRAALDEARAEVAYLRRAHHEMTNAAADERDRRVEGTTEPSRNSDIEALIEASSLGTPEAKAAREAVAPEIGSAVALAAKYLGRAKAAESALAAVRALADDLIDSVKCGLNCGPDGKRWPYCSACEDSTEDHDCPPREDCEHTVPYRKALALRAALATPTTTERSESDG